MSSYNSKCQLAGNAKADHSRDVNLAVGVKKAISQIRIDDNFWNVSWKGLTFSIKPFLCSGLSFIKHVDMFHIVVDLALKDSEDFYERLSVLTEKEYDSFFTKDENNMYNSIMFQFHSQVPCIVKYLIGTGSNDVFRRFIFFILRELSFMCDEKGIYIRFKDRTLCNTQAFSYYLSMYWALQKSKKIQMLLMKDIKTMGLEKLLDFLCPEESLHYKVLSGVVSSKELASKYFSDNKSITPISARELAELMEVVSDDSILLAREVTDSIDLNDSYECFIRVMACSFITCGAYTAFRKFCDDTVADSDSIKEDNNKLLATNRELRNQIKDLKRDLNNLEDDLNNKVKEFDTSTYKNKIKSLEDTVTSLKQEISTLSGSLDVKDKLILEQKQTISTQIKKIKSLNASLDKYSSISIENEDVIEEIESDIISIDDMVDKLKDFKIAIFGGYDSRNFENRFESYGLSVKQYIDGSSFTVGSLDCAVILTINITHHTVRNIESQFNGKILYFNGTNVELMIKDLYRLLCVEV